MDIKSLKLDLVHWLSELQDPSLLEKLQVLKEHHLSKQQDKALDQSLDRAKKQVAKGKVKPHKEIRKKYQQWL